MTIADNPSFVAPRWFADQIHARMTSEKERLTAEFRLPNRIRSCVLDDLMPDSVIDAFIGALPSPHLLRRRKSGKERKYVTAEIDTVPPVVRNLVLAFNDRRVVDDVAAIMEKTLEADGSLYNGGFTIMAPGDFMFPHLDNSHDYARRRRRDVVLLYYLTPNWRHEFGGNLELWDDRKNAPPREIPYRANRLVIMETTEGSWHSITPIVGPATRVNITCYYYAPPEIPWPVRLTRFRGRSGEPLRDLMFTGDFVLRTIVNGIAGRRIRTNRHVYRGDGETPHDGDRPEPR